MIRAASAICLTLLTGRLTALDLEAITVTGTRDLQRLADSPVVTEVIDAEEVQASGAGTLTEVLQDYGIIVDGDQAHGDQAALQGLGSSRVLFLIDGRRIVGRVAQNLEGSSLALANVDRIEVVRGPQSALYGSDAMGGVVNIITKPPRAELSGSVQAENTAIPAYDNPENSRKASPTGGDLWRSQRVEGVLNLPLGDLWTVWSAAGSRSGFYYEELGEVSILPRSLTGKLGVDATWAADVKNRWNWGGSISAVREEDQVDFTLSLDQKDLYRAEVYGGWKTILADASSVEWKLYDQGYSRQTSHYVGGLEEWTRDDPEIENLLGAEVWYVRDLTDENTLTVGLETTWNLVQDSDLKVEGGWASTDRQAFIVQDAQIVEDRYSILSGLRLERGSRFGLFAAPKISAMLVPTSGLRLLAGAGVGYRAPSTEDLYYDIDWSWHPIVKGNADLTPEYSLAGNAGAEWTWKDLFSARIQGYHQELFDEIVFVEAGVAGDGRTIFQNENKDRTSRTGYDLELSAAWGSLIRVDGSYGFLFAWDRAAETELTDQAAHRLRTAVSLVWKPWGSSLRASGQWDSLRKLLVLDLGLTQGWGDQFETFIRGENLTSALDPARGPFTPVTLTLGARYRS